MNPLWQNIFRSRTDEQSLAYFLGTLPAFNKLEQRDLDFLENIVHIRNYQAEEMVFSQGDIGSGMYVIRTGQIRIFNQDEHNIKTELALLEPGEFLVRLP